MDGKIQPKCSRCLNAISASRAYNDFSSSNEKKLMFVLNMIWSLSWSQIRFECSLCFCGGWTWSEISGPESNKSGMLLTTVIGSDTGSLWELNEEVELSNERSDSFIEYGGHVRFCHPRVKVSPGYILSCMISFCLFTVNVQREHHVNCRSVHVTIYSECWETKSKW